jgi:hypothetical protein
MNVTTSNLGRNIKKRHLNVANGVKWDKMSQTLLGSNELRSVIVFGERILCEFGAKIVENWVERWR